MPLPEGVEPGDEAAAAAAAAAAEQQDPEGAIGPPAEGIEPLADPPSLSEDEDSPDWTGDQPHPARTGDHAPAEDPPQATADSDAAQPVGSPPAHHTGEEGAAHQPPQIEEAVDAPMAVVPNTEDEAPAPAPAAPAEPRGQDLDLNVFVNTAANQPGADDRAEATHNGNEAPRARQQQRQRQDAAHDVGWGNNVVWGRRQAPPPAQAPREQGMGARGPILRAHLGLRAPRQAQDGFRLDWIPPAEGWADDGGTLTESLPVGNISLTSMASAIHRFLPPTWARTPQHFTLQDIYWEQLVAEIMVNMDEPAFYHPPGPARPPLRYREGPDGGRRACGSRQLGALLHPGSVADGLPLD